MKIDIGGVSVNYRVSGEGRSILLLHGWGTSLKSFEPVHNNLEKHFKVYSIDFPGFGESEEPPEPWDVEAYTNMLRKFITDLNIEDPILVGHSFGGRVSIRYAAHHPVHKIILVDSAGVKPKRKLSYYYKVYTYKTFKKLLNLPGLKGHKEEILTKVKGKLGSADYKNVSGVMQQTMVKVVNEDLQRFMPEIKAPTLLVWGENDTATPVGDAEIMEKAIPNAGLVVLKGVGHYSYLEKLNEFLVIIDNFLEKDKEWKDA
ncbi:alpha/beta fold hydrolase [Pseudalkalibacillus berkeleyi]|uniref:Alpha/beta hydrolase n=1 Tax=Pseudalkalibacillus berkeleyi TaxID=1069813 RepID=A0ABS9H5L8_9BACL|nr:alpha/beta hydrolase [Pseudalkalibacillus berkeleyi]MCF6139260.1 alpha/beta hydrolase [Pseudalkalibacillus berkeleyi]